MLYRWFKKYREGLDINRKARHIVEFLGETFWFYYDSTVWVNSEVLSPQTKVKANINGEWVLVFHANESQWCPFVWSIQQYRSGKWEGHLEQTYQRSLEVERQLKLNKRNQNKMRFAPLDDE